MPAKTVSFRNDDLVLKVRNDFDPSLIELGAYEAFVDALCGDREYQKQAIFTACRFLAGGQYEDTAALARENYDNNPVLAERYGSLSNLEDRLPFADKLSCCVDLATGTGKSWVMYGVARILLAEGIVDRVLILCPSLTIESGLTAKFKALTADGHLRDLIPATARFRNPEVVNADTTTRPGDICIENIHATFAHVRSSVRDSFRGRGESTLVLNDETHHVFSPPTGERILKRWAGFLEDPAYGFRRIVGLSGTCYVKNDYLPNVVSRYSLRSALSDGVVKEVRYVSKDESLNDEERFQKYLQRHQENQDRHPGLKPLSVVVSGRQKDARALAAGFATFLATELDIPLEDAAKRTLVVTSAREDVGNVAILPFVDRSDNPVEWIFSVSMLTEGWDVENVFQIIPHEKRAFNSKLLISQVLGRGLRVPPRLQRPAVWVFNHSSWSKEIEGLVDEVLEQERRLRSYPVEAGSHSAFHFEIDHLSYRSETTSQTLEPKNNNSQVQLFVQGHVNFQSQPVELEKQTVFSSTLGGAEFIQRTQVHQTAYSVDEVVSRLHGRLKSVDLEGDTRYAKDYPRSFLRKVIETSLDRIGESRDLVSEENLQHAYRAMGNVRRDVAKAARIEMHPEALEKVSTRTMQARSAALSSFYKETTVFCDSESESSSEEFDQQALAELTSPDAAFPRRAVYEVDNLFRFKSPVNVVLTTHEPERRFVARLFEPTIAEKISAWVKAPDVGFYSIAFSWRKGNHTKQANFNPDLFIRLSDDRMLVIELKSDAAVTDENRAKRDAARDHFERLNEMQADMRYSVHLLSPDSYDGFFDAIKSDKADEYVSSLEAGLGS